VAHQTRRFQRLIADFPFVLRPPANRPVAPVPSSACKDAGSRSGGIDFMLCSCLTAWTVAWIAPQLPEGMTMTQAEFDAWSAAQSYEHYMGRWSRRIAAKFIDWVDPPPDADWLEVGCGTGALTQAVLSQASPLSILSTDRSADFVAHARSEIADARASFQVADAAELPCPDACVDVVTSGLVLNFIPDRQTALAEMRRVLRPGGVAAFYVWDYPGGGMGFIDVFWKAAAELDPGAVDLDESARFPFCQPRGLTELCSSAGACKSEIAAIEEVTRFPGFDAFWHPFTLGAGPAPGYVQSLSEDRRQRLKDHLAAKLGTTGDLTLPARAWAVKAIWPAAGS
jgi:SAM-dependent methyltransferase